MLLILNPVLTYCGISLWNPSDMTCIYSTLLFIASHARRHGVMPILTFDQPLWLKALTIRESIPPASDMRQVVLRLGFFHTEMSFLGAIGHTINGSGLYEVIECVYASNAVSHMLSGEDVTRAVCGHLLVSGVLSAKLVSHVLTFN